jgi:hypothetical protein
MSLVVFVSSLGDTDLIIASINKLREENFNEKIFLIPLTPTAKDRIPNDIKMSTQVILLPELPENLTDFISSNNIQRAYIGVPSNNNEKPFQIAQSLSIPHTIVFEYMYTDNKHPFWKYIPELATNEKCDFVVPLNPAKENILKINSKAKIHTIGHSSIDRFYSSTTTIDKENIRDSLLINSDENFLFISGTSQPREVDDAFLKALLEEISTAKCPNIQLRMGLHPGILNSDPDKYLETLLNTCTNYPNIEKQFKIILTKQCEEKLKNPIPSHLDKFILRQEIIGENAAKAADKVAQAVPGALVNEAILEGKPSYIHDRSITPYLEGFSKNLYLFFTAKQGNPQPREKLGLEKETAPNLLAKLMKQ